MKIKTLVKQIKTYNILNLSFEEKLDLLHNQNLDLLYLYIFSNDEDRYIRSLVACHQKTPQKILKKLSKDPDFDICKCIELNLKVHGLLNLSLKSHN